MSNLPTAGADRCIAQLARAAADLDLPICFDSAPLIDYIADEQPTTALLEQLLLNADVPIVISTITLAEVVARPAALGDEPRVRAIHGAFLQTSRLRIVDFGDEHAPETVRVRAETGPRLPDAAIVATARLAGASALIGNDRQWRAKPLDVPYHHVDDILALR